jgi:hypothetical protein
MRTERSRVGVIGALVAMALAAAACGRGDDGAPDDGAKGGATSPHGAGGGGANGPGGTGAQAGGGAGGSGAAAGGSGGGDGCVAGAVFDVAALEATVQFLASDELEGRAPGTPGDEATRAYIADRFACLGLLPAGESFQQPFVTTSGVDTANVVGYLPGSDPALASEIIVVGAHHDHLGVIDGEIHNGANDNASGVAAMLAMAQALRQLESAPRRTVAFAAFGFEESDVECEGSYHWVEQPPPGLPLENVVYMVNLDMVGTYPLEERVDAYGSFQGTAARALLDELAGDHPGLNLQLDLEPDEGSSDFQAFSDEGVPYLYFETWDKDCYHSPCDDADHLDYPSLSDLGALAFEVVVGLADSPSSLAAASWASAPPRSGAEVSRRRQGPNPSRGHGHQRGCVKHTPGAPIE